jgi:hypothetical protein
VDNCPYNIHRKISDYLLNTQVSLLTIGNENDEGMANFSLSKSFTDEIIENISNETGNPDNTNLILNVANGNLRSAIALINSFQPGEIDLPDDYLARWNQILGKQLIDNKALSVLESLSLFTHVGYTDKYQYQSDFVIKQTGIESRERYEDLISQLAGKGIVKITGDFVALEAFVEELANKRLEHLQDEDVNAFLEEVAQYKLSKQFSDRVIDLSKTKNFKSTIQTLSHPDSILRSLKFIDSDQGARILMNLAEIEPGLILSILSQVVNTKDYVELKLLRTGRRYLVWTLERLVFREETFHDAAKLLFKLAVAENEYIGNNATAQFIQLFKTRLPGTTVSLKTRLTLLREMNHNYSTPLEQDLLLKAMDAALRVRGFIRMGSADKQGNDIFEDYQPDSGEVYEYQAGVIKILLEHDGQQIITDRLADQFYNGNQSTIIDAVEQIVERDQTISKNLRQQLDYFLNDTDILPVILERIQALIDKYTPNNIRDQLEYFVVNPPYLRHKDEQGRWINKSEEKAIELALKLLESNEEEWLNDIDVLLKDEQRLSFSFGKYGGTQKKNWTQLIEAIVNQLLHIPPDRQNTIFLEGYIACTVDQNFIRWTIDQLLAEKAIAPHAIKLSKFLKLEMNDLIKLYPIIEENSRFSVLMQPLNIETLGEDELAQFFDKLRNVMPNGPWVAIEIASQDNNEEYISAAMIEELLKVPNILKGEGVYSPFSFYGYVELLKKLDQQGLNTAFVSFLANEITNASEELSVDEFYLKEIVDILFSKYWDIAWPIIARKFQDVNFWGWYNLKNILRLYKGFDQQKLISWMDQYPDSARQKVIEIIDWSVNDSGPLRLSPLVMQMLDKYARNKIMLDYLSSILHSYSWVGSVISLLQSRMNMLAPLLQHAKPEIREFARQNIDQFAAYIDREKRDELNESLNN